MRHLLSFLTVAALLLPAAALAQNTSNYREQGGARNVIGGSLDVVSGGDLDIESGGTLKIAGTAVTSSAAELNIVDGVTSTAAELNQADGSITASVGTVGAAPASGTNAVSHVRSGNFVVSTFTLTAAQIPVTDAAGSGSYGTLKLHDFPEGGLTFLGCRTDYTVYAEGAALTGAAGDAVFEIGLGTAAIAAAADGVLAATNDDICGDVNQTLSGGTTTGTGFVGAQGSFDGTATALDLNLNWSGTAATIDANSTIDVTATITVLWAFLGDD